MCVAFQAAEERGVNIYSSTLKAEVLISLGRFADAIHFLLSYPPYQHTQPMHTVLAWPLKLSEAYLHRAQKLWIPLFASTTATSDIQSAISLLSRLDPAEMMYEPAIRASFDRMKALSYLGLLHNNARATRRRASEDIVASARRLQCRATHMFPHQEKVWCELAIGTGNVRAALSALRLSPANERCWIVLGDCFALESKSNNDRAKEEAAAASAERAYIRAITLNNGNSQVKEEGEEEHHCFLVFLLFFESLSSKTDLPTRTNCFIDNV